MLPSLVLGRVLCRICYLIGLSYFVLWERLKLFHEHKVIILTEFGVNPSVSAVFSHNVFSSEL